MAKNDDLDLIRLFGLSSEEANGLGLDASGRPPADDLDGAPDGSALPRHAEPVSGPDDTQTAAPIPLSRTAPPRGGDDLLDDELALFAMLDSNQYADAETYKGHGATRGLDLAATAEPLPRPAELQGFGSVAAPLGQLNDALSPGDLAVDDGDAERFIVPADGLDDVDDADLVNIFGLSAEEASGLGLDTPHLATTSAHDGDEEYGISPRLVAGGGAYPTGLRMTGSSAFPTMHLHAIGDQPDDEDNTNGFFIPEQPDDDVSADPRADVLRLAAEWGNDDALAGLVDDDGDALADLTDGDAEGLEPLFDTPSDELFAANDVPNAEMFADTASDAAVSAALEPAIAELQPYSADDATITSPDALDQLIWGASTHVNSASSDGWDESAPSTTTAQHDASWTDDMAMGDDWSGSESPTYPGYSGDGGHSGDGRDARAPRDTGDRLEAGGPREATGDWLEAGAPRAEAPQPIASYTPPDVDPDLLDAFAEESAELLDGLHLELERLEGDVDDHGALLETRRLVHTLKGGAKMCGFEVVAALAHSCENLLDLIADGVSELGGAAMHALFDCEPLLRVAVQDAIAGVATDVNATAALAARFDALCAAAGAAPLDDAAHEHEAATDREGAATPLYALNDETTAAEADTPETAGFQPAPDHATGTAGFQPVPGDPAEQAYPAAPRTSDADQPSLQAQASVRLNDIEQAPTPNAAEADVTQEYVAPIADATAGSAGVLPVPSEQASAPILPDTPGHNESLTAPTKGPVGTTGDRLEAGGPSQRPAGRRNANSINVDLTKVDTVVAKVTEMAAHRASSQGMIGQLMETSQDARRNVTRLHNLVMQVGNECNSIQPDVVKDDDLNLESYNALNTLVIQLQEAVSDQQALIQAIHDTITSHWSLQATESRVDADIQSALMSIRLIPIASMRVRLDGVVRQAAEATGKLVRWQLQGSSVAVEKNVFDRLFEPLMHLLRNAIDHGIETPVARREAGKPETGAITVSASQEGNQIVIAVSDDGEGIIPNKIAALAVERGVISAEAANAMSHQQKIGLIFTPGFSTADKVSHISGRGVGMDAVREACLRMGGSIDVTSRPGVGTTFTMRLPLSLSVTRGLIVRDGGCLMVTPVAQVVALHLVPAADVVATAHGRVARIEGQELPVYNLPPLPGAAPANYVQNGEVNVLQVTHEGGSIGLLIEDVLGEEEVLIKAPPALLRGVKTLLGAYVLPDGRVAPVVNLPQMLIDLRPVATLTAPKQEGKATELRALVVDDSMSMRVALSGTLQGAGFTVLTARDGQEALDVLKREGIPALITLDVEMPRMDGLETLFAIRQMPGARELPVFMMTSRGGAKHRRAAEQLGATRYFTKPYRDSELATAAREVCAHGISV